MRAGDASVWSCEGSAGQLSRGFFSDGFEFWGRSIAQWQIEHLADAIARGWTALDRRIVVWNVPGSSFLARNRQVPERSESQQWSRISVLEKKEFHRHGSTSSRRSSNSGSVAGPPERGLAGARPPGDVALIYPSLSAGGPSGTRGDDRGHGSQPVP